MQYLNKLPGFGAENTLVMEYRDLYHNETHLTQFINSNAAVPQEEPSQGTKPKEAFHAGFCTHTCSPKCVWISPPTSEFRGKKICIPWRPGCPSGEPHSPPEFVWTICCPSQYDLPNELKQDCADLRIPPKECYDYYDHSCKKYCYQYYGSQPC
jgi:hypothetical protein